MSRTRLDSKQQQTEKDELPPNLFELWRELAGDLRAGLRMAQPKTLLALVVAPVLLTLAVRLARLPIVHPLVRHVFGREMGALLDWYGVFLIQFLLLYAVPVLCIRFVYQEKLSDYGHRLRPLSKLWPLMLLLVCAMAPVVYVSSQQPSFSHYYPLYRGSYDGWGPFLLFEAGISSLFFVQEFFFRGFLIESLKPQFGRFAILMSTAMYGIAHYTKPLPEQLGAFLVGNLLGYLGDRYRTFYLGVLVHYLVAVLMDGVLVVPTLLNGVGK